MCGTDGTCGPCKSTKEGAGLAIMQAGTELSIWGPMSVELVSEDKKLIRLAAVQRTLPSLIRRGRFTVMHADTIVGEISPLLKVDSSRLPADPVVQAMVKEVVALHGGLPTAIMTVTPAIAAAFPRVKSLVGQPVAFAGGTLYEDDRIGEHARAEVLAGKLDSFSVSGSAFKSRKIEWCDPTGCNQVDEVLDLDLSTITLCSTRSINTVFGPGKARNPGAAFVVVQQACACGKMPCECVAQTEGSYTTATPGTSNPTFGDCKCGKPDCDCVKESGTPKDFKTDESPTKTEMSGTPKVAQGDVGGSPKEYQGAEAHVMEMMRRLEQLEQELALLKGQQPTSPKDEPTKEAAEGPKDEEKADEDAADKPGEGKESEVKEDEDMSDDKKAAPAVDDKKDDEKKVEQATPAVVPSPVVPTPAAPALPELIAQAVAAALKDPVVLAELKQALTPPVAAPVAAPVAPVSQSTAAPRQVTHVETPEPAAPAPGVNGMEGSKRILQALDRGEPNALRSALEHALGKN